MIGYTVAQAAARVSTGTDTIEAWITAGWLHAPRHPIDGHRYVDETHLLDVDQAVYTTGSAPQANPTGDGWVPLTAVAAWITTHIRPVTPNTVRDWVSEGLLVAKVPSRGGPGRPALYDRNEAAAIAIYRTPRVGTHSCLRDATQRVCCG